MTVVAMMERVKGIEPSYAAWEAAVLPLNYTRNPTDCNDMTGQMGCAEITLFWAWSSLLATVQSP